MTEDDGRSDKHFPKIVWDNPIRRLFQPPLKLFGPYVTEGQTVADLGCGPGYFALAMAQHVGPDGKVFAVDSDEKCIRALKRKAGKRRLHNVDARVCSAHDLGFIADGSVDFLLANGLLCAMAPRNHEAAVKEFKRVMAPRGRAYISVAQGTISYVEREEWEEILQGFEVHQRNDGSRGDQWAVVSLMDD